ncbi:MAG: F0F1 ATP synthase subunit delta [Methylomonas sp.]|jgi:F-type H+-transporting ATPase subunit delta
MAELTTLARPYAEAAFKWAKQTNAVKEWSEILQFLSMVTQDKNLMTIVGNPKVGKDKVMQLLLEICQGNIPQEGKNLLKLLAYNGKLALLPNIALLFEAYKSDDEGYLNVELYSAYPLTKAEQNKYCAMLEKQFHRKINAAVSIDKSLIGGILAVAGDKVIDGSIRGQIHQLAKRL